EHRARRARFVHDVTLHTHHLVCISLSGRYFPIRHAACILVRIGGLSLMILVFGSHGTVGSEVVKALEAKGASFRAASPDHTDFTGVDKIFLLSPGIVVFEIATVNAAKAAGVKHVVKLSVLNAETEAFAFAKVIHRPVEKAIEQSGLAWTFLRPNGFMQNMA